VQITLGKDVARQINLQLQPAKRQTIEEKIRASGETRYAPSKYARVAPRISGVLREVKVILGQEVDAGTPLAVLESPDFGSAKSDYWQAQSLLRLRQQTFDQQKSLFDKKIASAREMLEAETALEEAKLTLRRAEQKLAALSIQNLKDGDTSTHFEVTAPFKGVVVETAAVPGETATPEKPIFSVADVERMWACIDVYDSDLPKLQKDQKVVFVVEGLQQKFPGRVVTVGAEVDDRTRTIRVYAELKNVQGLLKVNMFGRAEISIKAAEPKLLVPKDAVQNDGDCDIVFVSPVPNVYQARKIRLGPAYGNGFEVLEGLADGEQVVTTGSFLLKTEVLRGQMGAG
jgi:cobalt-zinc-cadmium efflux system membrane fusion protein